MYNFDVVISSQGC